MHYIVSKQTAMTHNREEVKKIREFIEKRDIAMLCTMENDEVRSRPMSTTDIDDQGNIWFFTNEFSDKVEELQSNPKVCLAYSKPQNNTYVSINGTASLVTDRKKMEEYYSPVTKAFFKDGLDDPKIALLKIEPYYAEYWDSNSSRMISFIKILAAAVSGKEYKGEGRHGELEL